MLPVLSEDPPVVSPAQPPSPTDRQAGKSLHAWRIIGGFDNHSHAPKTNAITKLIVFKVEAGGGKEKSAIMGVLTVQRAQRIMDA